MEMDMVADMKVDKVAHVEIDIDINMEIHFGESWQGSYRRHY